MGKERGFDLRSTSIRVFRIRIKLIWKVLWQIEKAFFLKKTGIFQRVLLNFE